LKNYEWESLLKSFFIFFILLEVLLGWNFWNEYHEKKQQIADRIQMEMKLCAYKVECNGMVTDFVEKRDYMPLQTLQHDHGEFYGYYKVPTVDRYVMKIVYPQARYLHYVEHLKNEIMRKSIFYTLFAMVVSLLFAIYALRPLQRALQLNEEFVKDILHDLNTPISSLRINLKLLKREKGESEKIERMEHNIQTILALQDNLQIFLKGIPTQTEVFALDTLLHERMRYFQTLFPDIIYTVEEMDVSLSCNKEAFVRIIDNLVSNASKYNAQNGRVRLYLEETTLYIQDTGKGIKNPSKIFNRYYKEQERGIGIGLHIVKKLCDELGIKISVDSQEALGTIMILDLKQIIIEEA